MHAPHATKSTPSGLPQAANMLLAGTKQRLHTPTVHPSCGSRHEVLLEPLLDVARDRRRAGTGRRRRAAAADAGGRVDAVEVRIEGRFEQGRTAAGPAAGWDGAWGGGG